MSRVIALVGSLRAESVTRRLAETAASVAPEGVRVDIFEGLGDLPFYNEDIDNTDALAAHPAVDRLRTAVGDADAVLLLTPEYNGTIPAVLKNAIDWASRPFGDGAIKGKPTAVISSSPSANAARWAKDDTAKAARVAGATVLDDADLAIGSILSAIDGKHPRDNSQIAGDIAGVVSALDAALVDA
ncbi:NAD(P)H-dependent oxidoreductase [Rhodococcoides corynebacterioides]|uniref:NAD(P)H-dependent oxidoreductase n=1 Tax=Rhodococcoides corynebacterioides TaxID=53972 RepID=UPI0008347D67|nr:NAD(P)H-dependent oxidoreductase [Rhodococcus corynebacterioides]MBY6362322.1 NAD(P)H-dependent oxidoreductase [Rhodococcus corynebacterioides]